MRWFRLFRLFRLYRWRRHPLWFWLVTLGLAGLTALTAAEVAGRASASVERWGRLALAVVVVRGVPPGAVLGDADVRVERVPARLVPEGGLASVDDVVGRVALVALWPGEVVVRGRLAPDGQTGVAALVPKGMRAVALPVTAGLRVAIGATVDVLATFDIDPAGHDPHDPHADPASADAAISTEPTVVVAEGVAVVDVQEEWVTVAVPALAAPRVAFAAARATLTLALTPHPVAFSTSPPDVENAEGVAR